jgi:hypothetical protein
MAQPLAETEDAITEALRAEAWRLAEKLRWRMLLSSADQLVGLVEELNLAERKLVPSRLGQRIARLEVVAGLEERGSPETTGVALDRLFTLEGRLFRLLQPWWWDFHYEPDEADGGDGS